jgi:hypothetical protein
VQTEGDELLLAGFRTAWWQKLLDGLASGRGPSPDPSSYELTRFAVLRLLALVQLFAFVSLARQFRALLGSDGLLPAAQWMREVHEFHGESAYFRAPSLFWLVHSDAAMQTLAWVGAVLSLASLLGITNAVVELAIWALYMSFVHVGQIFYGYGWELQLLETTFLAAFLCPVGSFRPFPRTRAPVIVVWLLRWLIVRIMLGAALIKLRGDPCWSALSCLDYHFETQPNPSPLSWAFHRAPHAVHVAGVAVNHPRRARRPLLRRRSA